MDIVINRRPPRSAESDPRSMFRAGKPPIGGWLPGIQFTLMQAQVLNAAVDQFIPAGDGFPAPSEVDVLSFFGKYITPEGQEVRWLPFIGEQEFRSRLDSLGDEFVRSSNSRQIDTLRSLERAEPVFFNRFRDLSYYAYYSRPAIVAAINSNLEAGKDLRNSPQPYGYADNIDEWDDDLLSRVEGSYTRTEDVRRVEIPERLRQTSASRDDESQV